MRPGRGSEGRLGLLLLGLAIAAALVVFAARSLPYAGVHYDEGVQFWISRGVSPLADPWTPAGGLRAVLHLNSTANLDPGGFSLLLHFWLRASTGLPWIRALSLLFFLSGCLALGLLAWHWHPAPWFALFAVAVPLAYPLLLQHAPEIRAYGMEFAGVVWGCLALSWAVRGAPGLALAGLGVGFFLASRYSYAIFVAALGAVVAATLHGRWRRGELASARDLAPYVDLVGLTAVGAALVYVFGVRLQQSRILDGADYIQGATLAGKSPSATVDLLAVNLLSWPALPLSAGAFLALAPPRLRRGWLGSFGADPGSCALYRLALATLALSAAVWWWHPWDMRQRWSLYLHALSAVVVVRLALDSFRALERQAGGTRARYVSVGVAVAAILACSAHAATYRRTHFQEMTAALAFLESQALLPGSVAVQGHSYPPLRYLYEHGPRAGRSLYAAKFHLPPIWTDPAPLLDERLRYLLGVWPDDAIPSERRVDDASLPPNLHRLRGPGPS
jgi:hypothetical protein